MQTKSLNSYSSITYKVGEIRQFLGHNLAGGPDTFFKGYDEWARYAHDSTTYYGILDHTPQKIFRETLQWS